MTEVGPLVIETEGLVVGYGRKEVLRGVDLRLRRGEVVACVGHNGSGKSTLLRVLAGCLKKWAGGIGIDGLPYDVVNPSGLLKRGIVYLPQGNSVFGDLTVLENLAVRSLVVENRPPAPKALEAVWSLFPTLQRRAHDRASALSGGEKQCLALAAAFVVKPRVLLLDEPCLGLAPQMARSVLDQICLLNRQGVTMLIVEQRVRSVLRVSSRVYILKAGRVSHEGVSRELLENDGMLRQVFL